MPNWASSVVTIQGDPAILDEIANKMATPYKRTATHFPSGGVKEIEVKGNFLLWNIVSPDDLQTYYAEPERKEPQPDADGTYDVSEALNELATSDHWYAWNVRNWGTKWDISEAECVKVDRTLTYDFQSAWTPPLPALAKLASLFPQVSISVKFIEEGMEIAGEVFMDKGEVIHEVEYTINHGLLLDFYGECWVCSGEDEVNETMERYGCLEYSKDIEELNKKLGGE